MRGIYLGIVIAIACVPNSNAGLVFQGVALASGGELGSNNIVLVVQNRDSERGCVDWNAAAEYIGSSTCVPNVVTPAGDGPSAHPGAHETGGEAHEETGELSAKQIRSVLNPNEGGGPNPAIQIDELVVDFFDPDGNLVWGSSQSIVQPSWAPGIYNYPQQPAPPGRCSVCTLYMREPFRPSFLID